MNRRLTPLAAVGALALALVPALPAVADVEPGVGASTTPAQPYLGNPNASDWIGGYEVDGESAYSVRFALLEPDSDEAGGAPVPLTTKWGTALPSDVSREIAYLVWRYGDTASADEAAALAHLLHSWTSAPQNPAQLDPSNIAATIAYDAPFHRSKLPAAAQQLVDELAAEATSYADAWTASIAAPSTSQVGVAGTWTVGVATVTTSAPVPGAPIRVEVVGGALPGGATAVDVVTAPDGSPAAVTITPTSESVTVTVRYGEPSSTAFMVPAIDTSTSSWVRRADQVVAVTDGLAVVAAPAAAAPSDPELADTGPGASSPAAAAALLALLAGCALLVRRHRARRTARG